MPSRPAEPQVASGPSPPSTPGAPNVLTALRRGSGGAGGRGDGREGIEGEPIALDSADPKYTDYLDQVRRRIKEKWGFPCVKNNVTCEYKDAQLIVEFGILKGGQLQFVDLRDSSGLSIYDDFALNAIKLAAPYPEVPPSMLMAMRQGSTGGYFVREADDRPLVRDFATLFRLGRVSRAQLMEAQANRSDLTIRAPFAGTIVTRSAEPGEVVGVGTAIVTLVDLSRVYLRGFVPGGRIGAVKVGQAARVFLDSNPNVPVEAFVSRIDPQATFTPENTYFRDDRVKQVVGAKLQLKGAIGLAKPGMSADGEILVQGNQWPQQTRIQ